MIDELRGRQRRDSIPPAMKWVWLALLVLVACHRTSAPTELRVVSLSPSTTEAAFAIGAGPQVVGRSRYCNYPPEVTKLPQVGGYVDPSFEAILALRPSLVVGARGPAGSAIADRLEAQGIKTYFPPTETFAQIDEMILGLGARTGHGDDATKEIARLHARIAGVTKEVAGKPKKRVLLIFGLAPISVAGPGSFADEMLERVNADNVVKEGGGYPTIGVERVLALDPDVIVNAAMMEERAAERLNADAPGWSAVRAVKEGHVRRLTDESVLRPGPRIGDGLDILAKAIHAP
jgi:iron complex transport system substrate-binding protein